MKSKVLKEWTTIEGLKAKAILMYMGNINGYIEAPNNLIGKDYNEINVNIHGGLTYSGKFDNDNTYWFGFDTAHLGDGNDLELSLKHKLLTEETYKTLKEIGSIFSGEIRSLNYVINECNNLSKQLKENNYD